MIWHAPYPTAGAGLHRASQQALQIRNAQYNVGFSTDVVPDKGSCLQEEHNSINFRRNMPITHV